jgi:hypothetical protein
MSELIVEKKRKKLTITKVILVVIGLFIVWNIAWYATISIKYAPFTDAVPKNEYEAHILEKDGYSFNVKKPDYLKLTGNLGVSKLESMDALIIWPLLFGGYEYGIRLQDNGEIYEIYVDEKMNPIDENDTVVKEQIEKNREKIEAMIAKAKEMWPLN